MSSPSINVPAFYFDSAELKPFVDQFKPLYNRAHPFPHVVIDHFLPEWVIDKVLEEFPLAGAIPWNQFNAPTENKKWSASDEVHFGSFTRHLMAQFNSATFLKFLKEVTGIDHLIGDPYFLGGGMHQTYPGGFLKVHTDFNWHNELRLERRLNLLIYLNKDWKEEYGGQLELWDKAMTECAHKVLPLANRCVIFSTTRFSYHGHPQILTCPPESSRKSLAFYYYTAGRPKEQDYGSHGTLFVKKPNENWGYLRNFLARCVPPIFYDIVIQMEKKVKAWKK